LFLSSRFIKDEIELDNLRLDLSLFPPPKLKSTTFSRICDSFM